METTTLATSDTLFAPVLLSASIEQGFDGRCHLYLALDLLVLGIGD